MQNTIFERSGENDIPEEMRLILVTLLFPLFGESRRDALLIGIHETVQFASMDLMIRMGMLLEIATLHYLNSSISIEDSNYGKQM